MGMDVFGECPTATVGEYFRADVWSWRAIQDLMYEICEDVMSRELLVELQFNNGAAVCQTTALVMAERFQRWRQANPHGHHVLEDYYVDDQRLGQWIAFLEACGGFSVW